MNLPITARPWLAIWCLSFAWLPMTSAVGFRWICEPEQDLVAVQKDAETGEYVVVPVNGTRRLSTLRSSPFREENSWVGVIKYADTRHKHEPFLDEDSFRWEPGLPVANSQINISTSNGALPRTLEGDEVLVRKCNCRSGWNHPNNEPIFCPLITTHCGTYRKPELHNATLGCLTPAENEDMQQILAFSSLVWFAILVLCCLLTRRGLDSLNFALSKCIPNHDERTANRMLRNDPQLAREMILNHILLRRQLMRARLNMVAPGLDLREADEEGERPTSLALKTCIFVTEDKPGAGGVVHNDQTDGDEEDYDHNCIICFQPLVNGEKIGKLECAHKMHADCLKSWLGRRNACPLCNSAIASPRFDGGPNENSGDGAVQASN